VEHRQRFDAWLVRIPQGLKARIETVAREQRRKPPDMLRVILLDGLEQIEGHKSAGPRAFTTSINNIVEGGKADAA
jgi:hypothetical protein